MRTIAGRYRVVVLLLAAALVLVALLAVAVGSVWIPPDEALGLVAWKLGLTSRPAVPHATEVILFQLRLPRVLLATGVGAALAVSGLVFQGLFRNPLADPAIIGVSSGAALGAIAVIVAGGGAAFGGLGIPAAAFAGALGTAFLVYRLARIGPTINVATLLLAGVAMAALISAVMSLVMSLAGEQIRSIYFWLLGGLSARPWSSLQALAVVGAIGVVAAAASTHELNLVALGEERAAQLGVELEPFKRRAIATGALLAGAAVSVAGVIGFVGLMTPHALRLLIGADHRRLLPAVLLAGPTFLIGADLLARTVLSPEELPVGVVTALLGAPFFLVLLRRQWRAVDARH